jgi:hypothetical protein
MARFFTVAEATDLLPVVEELLREAMRQNAEYTEADAALDRETQRILFAGGALVNREEIAKQRERRDGSARALKAAIEKVHALGCQVKDLQIGLIDFPTVYDGQEVVLCWRLGEDAIRFWHGVEEGFRGRKPIDAHFLANHHGAKPN